MGYRGRENRTHLKCFWSLRARWLLSPSSEPHSGNGLQKWNLQPTGLSRQQVSLDLPATPHPPVWGGARPGTGKLQCCAEQGVSRVLGGREEGRRKETAPLSSPKLLAGMAGEEAESRHCLLN